MDESDDEETACPICTDEDCTKHLVIVFDDGHPCGGFLEDEWVWIRRDLKLRLVESWLQRKTKVDGPHSLTALLAWFNDIDRRASLKRVTGSTNPATPENWSEEVYEDIGLDDALDVEIEDVMLTALNEVDHTNHISYCYDKGPCAFRGNEIYASNPEAVARRFRMVLALPK